MPFTGIYNNEVVWPDDVEDGTTVVCPNCDDTMHVRCGHTTKNGVFRSRCFAHYNSNNCSGGESDTHKLMKYVVSRRLNRMFDHGTLNREEPIPNTHRIADVAVTFDEPINDLGNGVIAEVQYKNHGKDIQTVTEDYLRAGYSVYWIYESDFSNNYETVDFPELIKTWPNAVPEPEQWSGIESPLKELEAFGVPHGIEAKFPPDYFEKHKEQLKSWWLIGNGGYDFDLIRQITAGNSPRSCASCGDDASFYLFQDGVISTFRCAKHLPSEVGSDKSPQKISNQKTTIADGGSDDD